jgi:hypothetical protein
VFQRFLIGIFAPEITTVSNPKINPAREATTDHLNNLVLSIAIRNKAMNLFRKAFITFRNWN